MASKQKHDLGNRKRALAEVLNPPALSRPERRLKRLRGWAASYQPGRVPGWLFESLGTAEQAAKQRRFERESAA